MVNINKLFNRRNDAIKFVSDYGSVIFEAKRKAADGKPLEAAQNFNQKHQKQKLNAIV